MPKSPTDKMPTTHYLLLLQKPMQQQNNLISILYSFYPLKKNFPFTTQYYHNQNIVATMFPCQKLKHSMRNIYYSNISQNTKKLPGREWDKLSGIFQAGEIHNLSLIEYAKNCCSDSKYFNKLCPQPFYKRFAKKLSKNISKKCNLMI
jgi:hypothetical protein